MPTATLIRCGSTSSPPSVVVAAPSDDGGIGHHQEVVNCNSKDASIIIPPWMTKTIHKRKPAVVVKKSQQLGVKASVMTKKRKRCSHDGCSNGAVQGGVCITHGAKVTHKHCSQEGCTNQAQKGGVCSRMALGRNDANTRGVPIKSEKEEFVGYMAQRRRRSNAALKGAPTASLMEEYASPMVQ
jgi:hypothetical protein